MTTEATADIKSAADLPLKSFRVWYHLPVSLLSGLDFSGSDWREPTEESDFKFATYFHPHVAERLVGGSGLRRWRRRLAPVPFVAEYDKLDYREKKPLLRSRILGKVVTIDLFVLDQPRVSRNSPGLAIAVAEVEFESVSVLVAQGGEWPVTGCTDWRAFTLADAQNALEWVRRIFPRWYHEGDGRSGAAPADQITPGNTLARVVGVGEAPSMQDMADAYARTKAARVMPWIDKLLEPIKLDNSMAAHFGDDRAYMVSAIELAVPAGSCDKAILASVHPGDLYRLAECDTAGSGWPYSSAFLKSEAAVEFYTRHAPHLEGHENGLPVFSGNTSLYIMAPHHLCGLGAGEFFGQNEVDHIRTYYCPMQMICLIEYYRLLQVSQRLALLVGESPRASNDPQEKRKARKDFRENLLQLREDMLSFTHVHHFSNVSSQIQAREMFERLYRVLGIATMHREVDEELKAAADFAAMQDAREAAERAERLNSIVVLGIPAALVVGTAGMNLLVGTAAPGLWWSAGLSDSQGNLTLVGQIIQFAGIVAVVCLSWGATLKWLMRNEGRQALWFALAGFASAVVWFFGSGFVNWLRLAMGWPVP